MGSRPLITGFTVAFLEVRFTTLGVSIYIYGYSEDKRNLLYLRVHTRHGKPGKLWNFKVSFSRPGRSWTLRVGHRKSWKTNDRFHIILKTNS